jgi:CheY-like chemotaxis protein
MDVQMPEMDGLEATAMIRTQEFVRKLEQSTERHIPIIAMTAHAMVGDRDRPHRCRDDRLCFQAD